MYLVQVTGVEGAAIQPLLDAISASAPGCSVSVFASTSPPAVTAPTSSPKPDTVEIVVKALQPLMQSHLSSLGILRILSGIGDSWTMSKGEAKDSPRWLTIAMAKAIRGAGLPQQLLDPCESPLDLLVVRSRTYFPDGAYKGIAYSPTPLGEAVYKALSASST